MQDELEDVDMNEGEGVVQTSCLNCSASVEGGFCQRCGQSVRENSDRSIGKLLSDFLGNVFFLDNRFLLSVRYLFAMPGRMTVEFIEGKRKKFISPVTLFLFINLIYYFVSPLSDYSLSLYDQVYGQPYSEWIVNLVKDKMRNEGLEGAAYGITYQNMSDSISKSIMILNVPIIAVVVNLITFKRRRFYFDNLIFAFHFFTFFLLSWVMIDLAETLITFFVGHDRSIISAISFNLFAFILPLFYAILSIKKFMDVRWYWSIPAGLGGLKSTLSPNIRDCIFLLTTQTLTIYRCYL